MNKLKHILILLFVLQGITICAQKVSNITYRQEQSNIIVSYDLETKTPCKVSLYVSTNDGKTWLGPLIKVTGDVCDKIASGSHSITWNVLEEFEELRGDKIMFQVRAVGDNIKTLMIGTQEWTTKNLNVSKYRNGDIIPEVKDPEKWKNMKIGAWCYYNNDLKNGAIYGKLYNWYAVNDRRGLAPKGFHIPTDAEWTTLTNTLGRESVAGEKMMSTATLFRSGGSVNYENSSGFSGLPGGSRDYDGAVNRIGTTGYWWSSTEDDALSSWYRGLNYSNSNAFKHSEEKSYGYSVRCLKD